MGKRGPKTPEGKARAIANLIPCRPGQTANPKGRPPSAGLSIREWVNEMQGWGRAAIQSVVDDSDAPVNKIAAARVWLHATSKEQNMSGQPIAGPDFDRIMDRTMGKPVQAMELTGKDGGAIQTESKTTYDYDAFRRALTDARRMDAAGRLSPADSN